MTAISWGIAAAAALHVAEEYLWPGGFLQEMRRTRIGARLPTWAVVALNGVFLAFVLVAAISGEPVLVLVAAAIVAANGVQHVVASLVLRRYIPGTITGFFLYVPLGVAAFVAAAEV